MSYKREVRRGNEVATGAHVAKVDGVKMIGAGARAGVKNARAGVKVSPFKVGASAGANLADASAKVYLVEDVLEAEGRAAVCETNVSASASRRGLNAGAGARLARVEGGIKHSPIKAHAEVGGADATVKFRPDYIGAEIGAHLAEAQAGPFAVRAGVKFGAKIEDGTPQIDVGPVSCSLM